MSQPFAITVDSQNQLFRISGELTLLTATRVLAASEPLFNSASRLEIDLTEVTHADSAGLALLVSWTREARRTNKPIQFFNIPAQMLAIAEASGLDQILPQQ